MFCMNCKNTLSREQSSGRYCPHCGDNLKTQDKNIDWAAGDAIKPDGWRPFRTETADDLRRRSYDEYPDDWGR